MQKFRSLLLLVAVGAAALSGIYLINRINSDNSIDSSSASTYNILALNLVEDNILYPNNIVVELNAQILSGQPVNSGTFQISFDENLLGVEDIIMSSNIVAVNQKVENGQITLNIQTTNKTELKGISTIAKVVFNKKASGNTSITLLNTSLLGSPDTLEPTDKILNISL